MEDRTLLWERQFNEWCRDKFVNNKNTSPTVSQEYVNHVLQFLQSDTFPESFDKQEIANFKHKVFSFILLLAFVFVFKNYIYSIHCLWSLESGSFRPGCFRPIFGMGRFGLCRWVVSAYVGESFRS